jgi:hypothetical protein
MDGRPYGTRNGGPEVERVFYWIHRGLFKMIRVEGSKNDSSSSVWLVIEGVTYVR